jgi:CRP-like cAMP-binding protein
MNGMKMGRLGKEYTPGEVIIHQGEEGNEMFVMLSGTVEVIRLRGDEEIPIATLGKGEIFGEMALVGGMTRSATVRVKEKARILTVDKKGFLKRVHEDPSFAFKILETMSERIRAMDEEIARLKARKAKGSARRPKTPQPESTAPPPPA